MRAMFLFVGLFLSIVLIGLPLIALAMYTVGTEIDPAGSRVREYGSIVGKRWGKWQPLHVYSAITILRTKRVSTMYSRSQQTVDFGEVNHDVVLLDSTHRKKLLLKACDSYDEARTLAMTVSEATGYPIQHYSPRQFGPRRR